MVTPPHEKLVARLEQAGVLTRYWREAFTGIERHRFLPDRIITPDGEVVDRDTDPRRWLASAYDDLPIVTQVDEGNEDGSAPPISSASKPSVVADMLRRLDASPGMRVLEVGTGTGYNAALLSHRLGEEDVVTIEVDADLAERARERLLGVGLCTLVITGDGTQGWPARAPFDRVISTVAVRRVPYHWVAQTRPGGRILTPWGTALHNGVLADLHVGPHGTAHGRFTGDVAFMWVRDQRVTGRTLKAHVPPKVRESTLTRTRLHPHEPLGDFGASFAIGLHMPTVLKRIEFEQGRGRRFTVHLVDPGTGSWASWHVDHGSRRSGYQVRQHGPRSLFTELESAYAWWRREGRPEHTRFGLTVSAERQSVWLDHESRVIGSMP